MRLIFFYSEIAQMTLSQFDCPSMKQGMIKCLAPDYVGGTIIPACAPDLFSSNLHQHNLSNIPILFQLTFLIHLFNINKNPFFLLNQFEIGFT